MIAVRVADQNHMNIAQPRVCGAGYRESRIVKEADAGRILKEECPVGPAKFTRARTHRRDLDILRLCHGDTDVQY